MRGWEAVAGCVGDCGLVHSAAGLVGCDAVPGAARAARPGMRGGKPGHVPLGWDMMAA